MAKRRIHLLNEGRKKMGEGGIKKESVAKRKMERILKRKNK